MIKYQNNTISRLYGGNTPAYTLISGGTAIHGEYVQPSNTDLTTLTYDTPSGIIDTKTNLNASANTGVELIYSSDDTSIATVDSNGQIAPKASGTTTITITAPTTTIGNTTYRGAQKRLEVECDAPASTPAWEEWEKDLLTFTALEATDIGLFVSGMTALPTVYYKKQGDSAYTQLTTGNTISLNRGEQVKFYGRNDYFSENRSRWTKFTSTGKFNISGNVMTLLASGGTASVRQMYCFRRLFAETHVVDASALTLPSTQYDYMFYGCMQQCPYLQKLPVMPTPTHKSVYGYFCNKCPSLQSATLSTGVYNQNYSFQGMFQDCSGLTAVTIPAETVTKEYALTLLFQRCKSLQTIIFTNMTTLSVDISSGWFYGAEDTIGIAYVPANRTYANSRLKLPSGWSVQDLPT